MTPAEGLEDNLVFFVQQRCREHYPDLPRETIAAVLRKLSKKWMDWESFNQVNAEFHAAHRRAQGPAGQERRESIEETQHKAAWAEEL